MALNMLPYEILEKILDSLSYKQIANYCQTNKKSSQICDIYFTMRIIHDDIPSQLLPQNNLTYRYIQLYHDKNFLINNLHLDRVKSCFDRSITNDNIEEVIWLNSLMEAQLKKYSWLMTMMVTLLSRYSFQKDRDKIGKWFLSNLNRLELKENTKDGDVRNSLINIVIDALNKNKIDIIDHILNEYVILLPFIKPIIFCHLSKRIHVGERSYLNYLALMIKKYQFSPHIYGMAIKSIPKCIKRKKCLKSGKTKTSYTKNNLYLGTLELLLSNYPGKSEDLNKILIESRVYYPRKDALEMMIKYGLNDYKNLLYNMAMSSNSYYYPETNDSVKWLLNNHGDKIPLYFVKEIHDKLNENLPPHFDKVMRNKIKENPIKIILSEYLSLHNIT